MDAVLVGEPPTVTAVISRSSSRERDPGTAQISLALSPLIRSGIWSPGQVNPLAQLSVRLFANKTHLSQDAWADATLVLHQEVGSSMHRI
jgi:hypothetical protein